MQVLTELLSRSVGDVNDWGIGSGKESGPLTTSGNYVTGGVIVLCRPDPPETMTPLKL